MRPRVGCNKPVIKFMNVDLPDPFGPTRLVIPGAMLQVDAIDSENLSVEFGDIVEDDQLGSSPGH